MPKPSVNPMLTAVFGILVTLPAAVGRYPRPFDGMLSAATRKVAHSIMDSRRVTIPRRKSGKFAWDATSIREFLAIHARSVLQVYSRQVCRHGFRHCRAPRHRPRAMEIP